MLIFGTIGIFARYTNLPSDITAIARGLIGAFFLLIIRLLSGKKLNIKYKKSDYFKLVLSGTFLSANWILLFEAYKYTSVSVATLCYYFAPAIVLLLSPLMLKEKLTLKSVLCVLVSILGMMFVSNVLSSAPKSFSEIRGIICGLGAALCYAGLVITNKKISHIESFEKSFFQLFTAGVVTIPYALVMNSFKAAVFTPQNIGLLIFMGIVHTGFAYALYFSSMKDLSGQTVALSSYIDPVFAIIISSVIFPSERLSLYGIIGAALIIGAAILSEIDFKFLKK